MVMSTNDYLKEDLKSNQCDPLEQEQHYCFGSINRTNYDNIRVYTYCYGKQHLMVDTVIPNKQNRDPLKHANSPQGMLSLIDLAKCCGIKRKNE